jgi:hypothetical protein
MPSLSLPNTIQNGQALDALPVMGNFQAVQAFINQQTVHTDGSNAMTGQLALPGDPTQAAHAARKAYVDQAVGQALAGVGYVGTAQLADNSVTTGKIADSAVTTAKLGLGAVTVNQLANNAVDVNKILNGNVTNAKLQDNAVTTAKIADGNVTTSKLAFGAVTTNNITAGAVDENKIANGNVTAAKIAGGAVTPDKISGTRGFMLRRDTSQSIPHAAETVIVPTTTDLSSDMATGSGGLFTVARAGWWTFTLKVSWDGSTGGGGLFWIRAQTAPSDEADVWYGDCGTSNPNIRNHAAITALVPMNVGNQFDFRVYQDSGVSRGVLARITGAWLGPLS